MTLLSSLLAVANPNAGGGFWFPPQASTQAGPVDTIFFVIYWICVFFFVLIVAIMVLFLWKYRRSVAEKATSEVTHNTPLEVTWTIIPLILVIVIFYIGLDAYADMTRPPVDAYEVNVTAQKWNWTFSHRNGVTEDRLLVPVNRPVKLIMQSQDVLHSLFIPSFRVKQDVVPGRYTMLWFEANEPGVYQLFCTEYCGTKHSQMTSMVEVLPQEEFEAELKKRGEIFKNYEIASAPFLAHKFLYGRCASCHSLDGSTLTGPSYRQTYGLWGKNRVMQSGDEVLVDENYIRNSILDPQEHIVQNFTGAMPTFKGQLDENMILSLVELVKRLDEVVDENGVPKYQSITKDEDDNWIVEMKP